MQSFVDRIRATSSEEELRELYRWLFLRQADIAASAREINAALGLEGALALKPDLPCLAVGSQRGLVVLALNPGWKSDLNALEDAYSRRSPATYEDVMFNFFETHPRVVGKRVRWWSRPISFLRLLDEGDELLRSSVSSAERWQAVHKSRLLGGWDLFPWHSERDGLSQFIYREEWLHSFVSESARAAIRLKPRVLLIASKLGSELVRNDLLADLPWYDFELGTRIPVKAHYVRLTSGTEVVAVGRQVFANAPRDFRNEELFEEIRRIRSLAPGH